MNRQQLLAAMARAPSGSSYSDVVRDLEAAPAKTVAAAFPAPTACKSCGRGLDTEPLRLPGPQPMAGVNFEPICLACFVGFGVGGWPMEHRLTAPQPDGSTRVMAGAALEALRA